MRKLMLYLPAVFLLAFPVAVLAQEVEPGFDLAPFFPPIIDALIPAFVYVILFFVPKVKEKIPDILRPIIPMVLSILGGYLAGLVNDGTSAMAALFIGAASSIVYQIAQKWDQVKLGATVPGE